MDAQQLEALAQRLAANPADGEALQLAYGHGQTDPRGYAVFLEKAGALSPEPSNGAHWYCEAATVWTASLDDSHRAARALMHAVDKDPAGSAAADRLAALYAEKGDQKGVVALLERRIKLLERAVSARPELNALLGALLLQAGALWQEQFQQPEKALDAYQRATHHEPTNEVFERLRGLLVSLGRARDELPWIAEQARASADPIQRRDRFLEQAEAAAQLGDADVELVALRAAREADIQDDPTLRQRLGSAILSRIQAGSAVGERERHEARDLFVGLAEAYDGEYGLSYSQCALECVASDDRAAQLAIYYAEPLGRTAEIAPALARYLTANSAALLGDAARAVIFDVFARHGGDELLAALEPDESLAADERVEALTKLARALVSQKRPDDAVRHYERILGLRPAHEEAVDFVRSRLRKEKAHAALAELLRTAAAEESAELDQRVAWLEELAELSEGPLADAAGAIEARRRLVMLDPSDEDAALHLESALERAERWGDLAELLERRAAVTADVADRIVLELRLAELERDKRGDAGAAARALGRVARLEPDSQARGLDAVTALEKAGAAAAARELLADMLRERLPDDVRVAYSGRLGELLEAAGEHAAAGGAFAEVASRTHDAASWARAAEAFARAKAHEPAAHALAEQRALVGDDAERARLLSAEAEHLEALGDQDGVASRLREASELAPEDEGIAARLEAKYREGERFGEWVSALLARARKLEKPATRAALRKRAAEISRDRLGDEEGMCAAYAEVLEDEEDLEALRALLAASEKDGDNEAALGWFARLEPVVADAERGPLWLRWATLLEDSGDQEEALAKLRLVLVRTPDDEGAIERAAALERDVGSPEQAVELFERLLGRREGSARLGPARELARLEGEVLSRPERAFAAYQRVLELDAEDLETVERLRDLSERLERFEDLARYQKQLVEAEGDDDTAATLALQLAEVLVRLERSSEALTELEPFAELNPGRARDRYLELGDELGKQAHTARKLQEWLADLPAGVERQEALGVAYRRLVDAGVDDRALEVGLELLRQKGAPSELAESVERVALRARSSEGLLAAFGVLGRDTSGPARAAEMVRQAEQLAQVGVALDEVLLHGEQALTSALPIEVEPLLARLAALVSGAGARVDIYERQVGRCRSPEDRLSATVRAAEVASNEKLVDRARALLVLAVQTAGAAEGLDRLIAEVRKSDQRTNVTTQRALLAEVLALAGEAARDGGRSRAHYLSRAAELAHRELDERERAYGWLVEALVAHVDDEQLDLLERLAELDQELVRADHVVGEALARVHDGPLVRLLLRRRHQWRSEKLDDPTGAREDLKKLYDISPGDQQVAEKLQAVYEKAADHRGLVHLFEDQILRSKDQSHRAELARRVALIWQDTLHEPREAADAWRRVLRMKPGDDEAKAGLERAKTAQRTVTPEEIARAESEAAARLAAQDAEEAAARTRREAELSARRRAEEERIKGRLGRSAIDDEVTARDLRDDPGSESFSEDPTTIVPKAADAAASGADDSSKGASSAAASSAAAESEKASDPTVNGVGAADGLTPVLAGAARAEMATVELDRAELLKQAAEWDRASIAPADSEVTAVTAAGLPETSPAADEDAESAADRADEAAESDSADSADSVDEALSPEPSSIEISSIEVSTVEASAPDATGEELAPSQLIPPVPDAREQLASESEEVALGDLWDDDAPTVSDIDVPVVTSAAAVPPLATVRSSTPPPLPPRSSSPPPLPPRTPSVRPAALPLDLAGAGSAVSEADAAESSEPRSSRSPLAAPLVASGSSAPSGEGPRPSVPPGPPPRRPSQAPPGAASGAPALPSRPPLPLPPPSPAARPLPPPAGGRSAPPLPPPAGASRPPLPPLAGASRRPPPPPPKKG